VKCLRNAPEKTKNVSHNSDRQGLEIKSSPIRSCFILFYFTCGLFINAISSLDCISCNVR